MPDHTEEIRQRLLDAALVHVAFDGWSETTLRAAARDAGLTRGEAREAFPRGAIDLALAYDRRGDERMVERLRSENLEDLRFRDRIVRAIRIRIEEIEEREAARRGMTLFALPHHSADGARAVWNTADAIWTALGDKSDDANWYTKRATLSGVYAATLLFWLGDESLNHQDTWAFLDRRINDVMRIEKMKGVMNDNPLLRPLMIGPNWLMSQIKPPAQTRRADVPGGLGTPADHAGE